VSGSALLIVGALAALVLGIMTVGFGAPILAVPIILLLPGPIITLELVRRQLRSRQIKRFREGARTHKTRFSAQDRETLSR
jgi:Flp pilus assembly protein TadB